MVSWLVTRSIVGTVTGTVLWYACQIAVKFAEVKSAEYETLLRIATGG